MNHLRSLLPRRALAWLAVISLSLGSLAAAPLKVAYSDWPGWTAFAIAAEKGWFKDAGVDVELLWFEYGPSMEAYTAGKVDAVMVTNGDALVTGATGGKNIMILVTDYSNGNDMIVAKPGIKSLKALKGGKIGVEKRPGGTHRPSTQRGENWLHAAHQTHTDDITRQHSGAAQTRCPITNGGPKLGIGQRVAAHARRRSGRRSVRPIRHALQQRVGSFGTGNHRKVSDSR